MEAVIFRAVATLVCAAVTISLLIFWGPLFVLYTSIIREDTFKGRSLPLIIVKLERGLFLIKLWIVASAAGTLVGLCVLFVGQSLSWLSPILGIWTLVLVITHIHMIVATMSHYTGVPKN